MSRLAALALVVAACGSKPAADPTATRCAPHRKLELECADAETRKGLLLIGDMCQKILNGKNGHIFGPADQRRMEAELACATSATDCASYATCKQKLDEAAE